eukprot:2352036-Amphidinium_carterae.2
MQRQTAGLGCVCSLSRCNQLWQGHQGGLSGTFPGEPHSVACGFCYAPSPFHHLRSQTWPQQESGQTSRRSQKHRARHHSVSAY